MGVQESLIFFSGGGGQAEVIGWQWWSDLERVVRDGAGPPSDSCVEALALR